MFFYDAGQRGTAGKAATTLPESQIHFLPGLTRRIVDSARNLARPLSGFAAECIGPFEYLHLIQGRHGHVIPHTAFFSKQLSKRRTTRQTATPLLQRAINTTPRFTSSALNRTGMTLWPLSGSLMN